MIEIKVYQINKRLWSWRIKNGSRYISKSYLEYEDAWLANSSADKMKKFLEKSGYENVKIEYGKYDIPITKNLNSYGFKIVKKSQTSKIKEISEGL